MNTQKTLINSTIILLALCTSITSFAQIGQHNSTLPQSLFTTIVEAQSTDAKLSELNDSLLLEKLEFFSEESARKADTLQQIEKKIQKRASLIQARLINGTEDGSSFLTSDEIASLPTEIAEQVEQPVTVSGELSVISIDSLEKSGEPSTEYFITEPNGQISKIYTKGNEINGKTGQLVSIKGYKSGKNKREYFASQLSLSGEAKNLRGNVKTKTINVNDVPTAQLVETRKVLIAQINFNSTASILDTAQLQSQVFGTNNSVAQNVRESSYGALDVDGEITPVLSIPATVPVVTCDRVAVMSYGQNTLVTAGYNLANYQHIVYVFPATGCNWLGLAEIGGSRSWILSNTGVPVGNVLAHELWHNLNLAHASSYANCVNGNISQSTCTYSEYGDQSDSVGYGFWNFLPINSTHRVQKLWLANPNVKDITKNGLYTVQTMSGISKSPDQPMVLRIKKMDTNEYYYVSYRRPTGLDANLPTGNTDGIYIHVGNDAIVNNSKLIISPTGSQVFNEGQTFTDSVNDVSITLDSRTNSSASVNIVTKRTVKDPVFNPTKTTFSKPFNVSISSSTNGATIYYTTDGSLPTTSSKIYTNPISVKKTTSIKAYASKTAMNDSNIVSITYIK